MICITPSMTHGVLSSAQLTNYVIYNQKYKDIKQKRPQDKEKRVQ